MYCSISAGFGFCLLISIVTSGANYTNESNKEETHKMELLNAVSDNLLLKLDMYNLKLQQEFATYHAGLLDGFKNLLDLSQSSAAAAVVMPTTCAEALLPGRPSGVYQLHLPAFGLKPFNVYCLQDPNNGTAWTIVQRRQEPGTENFFRDWDDYKHGFGNLYGEFFLGLEHLYALTNAHPKELWIEMEDFESDRRHARYENFSIGDSDSAYALNVLDKFSGNVGNAFGAHVGRKFSTKDADHDIWAGNCAKSFTSGWWFSACHTSNLNGRYLRGRNGADKHLQGIIWDSFRGNFYSLKYVHMAIRPVT